ncbi:MAG: hypothetical protein WBZ14_09995, partial [Terriglobales bacterium]
ATSDRILEFSRMALSGAGSFLGDGLLISALREVPGLPWHRVVGSGGAIKLGGENGAEQKFRLRMEGVTFRGMRVDMKRHEFRFPEAKHVRQQNVN